MRHIVLTSLFLLALCSCKGDEETSAMAGEESAPVAESAAPAAPPADGGSPIGPISSSGQAIPQAGAAGEGASAAGIDFDLPAGWQSEPPQSNMRLAQATIEGPGGPGQLAVFYFGPGGGGGVDANIQRWIEQMEVAPGTQPRPDAFDANGYKVTVIDVQGTMKPSGMGMGPSTPQPDSRLLGAVVEGPGGPWFFKATGPEATLGSQREPFLKMLRSVRGQ
jgi:hypothetical protein